MLKKLTRLEIEEIFKGNKNFKGTLEPFGSLVFPFLELGSHVNTLNLFDLDELIILSFYWANRNEYHNVLDIGANVGLHSIVMHKAGFNVRAFEPDPHVFNLLKENLLLNDCSSVEVHNVAVSDESTQKEFIRLQGNWTGSHLKGAKQNPYGPMDLFLVKAVSMKDLMAWPDLIKIDVEGHEKEILSGIQLSDWKRCDALLEIDNPHNAQWVFDYSVKFRLNLFAQKINWQKVERLEDMPTSYREGTLFISTKKVMPWG